jgi:hypothetical protein
MEWQVEELGRLRNRHVAKLLEHLGQGVPPYLVAAIKRSYSMFASDVEANIISGQAEQQYRDNSGDNDHGELVSSLPR